MAKETATPAPAETKAEKKPEKKAPAESVYTVSERIICRGWLRRNIRYRTYYGRNEGGNRWWRKDDHRLQSR